MCKKIFEIIIFTLFSLALLILSISLYIKFLWPQADYEQIIMTLHDLTPQIISENIFLSDIFGGLATFIILWPFLSLKLSAKKQCFAIFIIVAICLYISGFITYAINSRKETLLYEKQYISPDKLKIEFPEKKRNLVLIYLESFEQNFTQSKHYQKNLLPHLQALQNSDNHLKNFHIASGTNYSIASLIAGHCGIPLRYKSDMDIYNLRYFLPQDKCFSQVLQENGYQTRIIKAADITFTRADIFSKSHGYQAALGVDELKTLYPQTQQVTAQGTFGGINDRTLFDIARQEIINFDKDKPFLLTLFTLDTHTPSYYKDPACKQEFNDLRDAFMCTDKIVTEFIDWLKTSPYWENTTVVIIGDHLLSTRIKTDGHPKHAIYNVFLNLPEGLAIKNNKLFSTFDLTPTILESLDIKLSPRAYGLGRSLFADEPTLAEQLGSKLNTQLFQKSAVYENFHKSPQKHILHYTPYALNQTLTQKDFLNYTDAYEELLGQIYLDQLNLELPQIPQHDLIVNIEFNALTSTNKHLTFMVNNQEIASMKIKQNQKFPCTFSFTIPKERLTTNKIQLQFRNSSASISPTQLGIAPIKLTIMPKK